jgi:hypothetical protein
MSTALGIEILAACEGEHPLGQGGPALRPFERVLQKWGDTRVLRHPPEQELQVSQHGIEQVVEVVGDAAGELTERFHFLSL